MSEFTEFLMELGQVGVQEDLSVYADLLDNVEDVEFEDDEEEEEWAV